MGIHETPTFGTNNALNIRKKQFFGGLPDTVLSQLNKGLYIREEENTMQKLQETLATITNEEFIEDMLNAMIAPPDGQEWHERRQHKATLRKLAPQIALWNRLDENEKYHIVIGMKRRLERSIMAAFTSSLADEMLEKIY